MENPPYSCRTSTYILITPTKTQLPNKVTFTGTGGQDINVSFAGVGGDTTHNSTHNKVEFPEWKPSPKVPYSITLMFPGGRA